MNAGPIRAPRLNLHIERLVLDEGADADGLARGFTDALRAQLADVDLADFGGGRNEARARGGAIGPAPGAADAGAQAAAQLVSILRAPKGTGR